MMYAACLMYWPQQNPIPMKSEGACSLAVQKSHSGTLSADREMRPGFGREGVAEAVNRSPQKMPRPPCRTHFSLPRVIPFQNRTRIALSARRLHWKQCWTSARRVSTLRQDQPERLRMQPAIKKGPRRGLFESVENAARYRKNQSRSPPMPSSIRIPRWCWTPKPPPR